MSNNLVVCAVPAALAVTLPLLTVATEELLVDQVTVPEAVAVNVDVSPTVSANEDLFKETESATAAAETVTVHFALAVPHFAVMVAVPAALAVTLPELTVATLLLLVDHVTVPLAVAVNVLVSPTVNASVDLFKETESVVVLPPDELPEDEPITNVTEPTYARFADVAIPKVETLIALLGVYV